MSNPGIALRLRMMKFSARWKQWYQRRVRGEYFFRNEMSARSFRSVNSKNRKEHKERSQPQHRQKLGFLEKKKDYRVRAKNFHKRERAIKKLQEKAALKNPDEFNFGMIKSQRKGGFDLLQREEERTTTKQKLESKNRDLSYLNYKQTVETGKIKKLEDNLHFIMPVVSPEALKKRHTIFVDDVHFSLVLTCNFF
eukprot:TRINITY_DN2992_c0_g1_i2.p1 TRINITY_DN2992_c0_g1~~TRINITY_DN2992_c0_g1_i2.p1  ORF type:complete len:195 (-),score=46.25 TRINITY_DN2992_c0_g1_i2:556-1140(-)